MDGFWPLPGHSLNLLKQVVSRDCLIRGRKTHGKHGVVQCGHAHLLPRGGQPPDEGSHGWNGCCIRKPSATESYRVASGRVSQGCRHQGL